MRSTSPGGTWRLSIAASIPVARSSADTSRERRIGSDSPRLRMSEGLGPHHVVDGAHDPVHDVVDVREVALHRAVAENRDGLAREEPPGECVDRHLRALTRTVRGEEPQSEDREAVHGMIDVTQLLTGLFGRRVGRDRSVDPIILVERHLAVVPVHRAGGGEDELTAAGLPHRLEQVRRADEVRLVVAPRVGQRRPDAGLGGQVHYGIEPVRRRTGQARQSGPAGRLRRAGTRRSPARQ